jgi:predicted nucleic acid-binding protein
MKAYADSNFLVRLHLASSGFEEATGLVERLHRRRDPALPVTWLHRAEVANAFQYHVFLSRQGLDVRVTPESAMAAQACFDDDLASGTYVVAVNVPTSDLEVRFLELSQRHTAKHGFRTYDLLHVASALLLGCETFWSFDQKANRLAGLEGLKILAKFRSKQT